MSYSIMEIHKIEYDEESLSGKVVALIDDFVLRYPATYEQPAEYGPALAEAIFTLDEGDTIPEDETELELFFEDLYLEWTLVDSSDWDD